VTTSGLNAQTVPFLLLALAVALLAGTVWLVRRSE
jgi:hypothetical protein